MAIMRPRKTTMKRFGIILALGLAASAACSFERSAPIRSAQATPAADTPASDDAGREDPCQDAPTQSDLNDCVDREYKKSDAALKRLYADIARQLDKDERATLNAAQDAFVNFREKNCEAELDLYDDGTLAPSMEAYCLRETTDWRLKQLKRIYGLRLGESK